MRTSRLLLAAVLPVALAASGCGAASASTGAIVLLAFAGLAVARERPTVAGAGAVASERPAVHPGGAPMPPPPCDGTRVESCVGGRVQETCCPPGAKCPTPPQFTHCGYGRCVDGPDVGRCPVRTTMADGAAGEDACRKAHGSWEKACVDSRVTMACIPPVPTNYTGPNPNVPFVTCMGDRCAPQSHPELCFPKKGSIADDQCGGLWKKACVAGRVEERCVPTLPFLRGEAKIRPFTACEAGSCVIGEGVKCP